MALYRRGQKWWADYYANGQRIQESTGTANKREAEKFLALRISEVQRGVFVKPVNATLAELGERYIEYAKLHKRSWVRDEQMLRHLNGFFGTAMLTQINASRVEQYQQKRVREVSPSTVNRELALLKHLFNMAERWERYQGKNPVRMVKFLAENNLQTRTLSEEEEQALLKYCPSYLQDMVLFAINTGLRCGDVFDLKWEEVDLERRRFKLVMEKPGKVLKAPLNDVACSILESWMAIRKGPYVFYNQLTGDRFRDLKAGLTKAVRSAALEGVTWHTFRHTFASRLTLDGTDLVTVKELLGHADISTTMRYAHTNDETKKLAVSKAARSDKPVTVIPAKRRTR
jgi:integrase